MNLLTLDDLRLVYPTNPDLVTTHLHQIGVVKDLEDYLWRLSELEQPTSMLFKLTRSKKRSKGIHPSTACKKGVCLKRVYYDCVDEVQPNAEYDRASQLTWDMGTFYHELHQEYFRQMYGEQFKAEVTLENKDWLIHSRTDGIFSFTNYRMVLEMKSIKEGGNYGWEKIQKKPFEDNIRQAHFYMWLGDIPFGLILYICKNNSQYKEHTFAFDDAIWSDIKENVLDPVILAVNKTGPMVEAKPGWGCKYCGYRHGCPEGKRGSYDNSAVEAWGNRS
jgi:hypothetical protein